VTGPAPDDARDVAQQAVEELSALTLAEHSLESVIERVSALAARVLPAEPAASLTVVSGGRPRTVAASDPVARELDELQYRLGSGPCLTAATVGVTTQIADTTADTRWTELARAAAERGASSVLSVPLPGRDRLAAGLNLYLRKSDEAARSRAVRLATSAAGPLANAYLYTSALERVAHLEAALDSRAVIEQAKGILMERFKITADQAFQALVTVSMESNVKLREVAERFVGTGELPGR